MPRAKAVPAVAAMPAKTRIVPTTMARSGRLGRGWLVRGRLVISASCCASNAIVKPTMSQFDVQLSFLGPLSILGGDATRHGVGSTGSEEMGDELAHFKTIRLCSITAALSNTIAVVVNRISRPAIAAISRAGPSKWAPQTPLEAQMHAATPVMERA